MFFLLPPSEIGTQIREQRGYYSTVYYTCRKPLAFVLGCLIEAWANPLSPELLKIFKTSPRGLKWLQESLTLEFMSFQSLVKQTVHERGSRQKSWIKWELSTSLMKEVCIYVLKKIWIFFFSEELGHYQKDGCFLFKAQNFISSQILCVSNERWFIREKLEHTIWDW